MLFVRNAVRSIWASTLAQVVQIKCLILQTEPIIHIDRSRLLVL